MSGDPVGETVREAVARHDRGGENAGSERRKAALLHALVDLAVARDPNRTAVVDVEGSWTYAELHRGVADYACRIAAAGVRPGDRVLIRAVARRWVLAALYACSSIGAIAVPLGADLRPVQWARVTRDSEPALVLDDPPPDESTGGGRPEGRPVAGDPRAAALVLYTSGSSAAPKGIVCSHDSILFATAAVGREVGYRADDVVLCRLPLSFDYGLYQAFLAASCGATLVLAGPGGDAGLLATMREHRVSVVPVVPSLASMLVDLSVRGPVDTVRLFTNTGQELTAQQIAALRRAFPGAAVQLMYGATECKRITIGRPDDDLLRPGSVGVPLRGTDVRVVDPNGRPVPPGVEGQIIVAGPHLMSGYWRDEELTERTFRRDAHTGERVLHTGDYGHLDRDGHLYFHGRRDHLFKQRGMRTSVAEIEAAARAVPDVEDAAVAPPRGSREAVLFAVTELSPAEVLRRLCDRLEPAKVPGRCQVLTMLPLGATGKTDRPALAALADDASR